MNRYETLAAINFVAIVTAVLFHIFVEPMGILMFSCGVSFFMLLDLWAKDKTERALNK